MGVIDVISFEGNNDVLIYKHPHYFMSIFLKT